MWSTDSQLFSSTMHENHSTVSVYIPRCLSAFVIGCDSVLSYFVIQYNSRMAKVSPGLRKRSNSYEVNRLWALSHSSALALASASVLSTFLFLFSIYLIRAVRQIIAVLSMQFFPYLMSSHTNCFMQIYY